MRRVSSPCLLALALVGAGWAADGAGRVEVHGFTSVGYLLTTGNEYAADDSTDGSTELWEFGLNANWLPADRWRIGGQIFARDYGEYDDGLVQLDWLFVEYKPRNEIGIQLGRVKQVVGLYGEELDVDSARVPVFLPNATYPRVLRDTLLAVDGAKVSGFLPAGDGGDVEYAAWGGIKQIREEGSTGQAIEDLLGAEPEIEPAPLVGAMVHWHTPVEGLGLRLSGTMLSGLEVETHDGGITTRLETDEYPAVTVSATYELPDWTFATEFQRLFAEGEVIVRQQGGGVIARRDFADDDIGWYLSATWHRVPDLELYAAIDLAWSAPGTHDEVEDRRFAYVVAARYDLLPNWLVKAEVNYIDGYKSIRSSEDGGEPEEHWWLLALKTTVDF